MIHAFLSSFGCLAFLLAMVAVPALYARHLLRRLRRSINFHRGNR